METFVDLCSSYYELKIYIDKSICGNTIVEKYRKKI